MYYDKRIRYLSYYESDIKLQNAGYAKFQVRDSLCQMIIYVKGPRLIGNGEAAVYLLARGQEASDNDSFYSGGRDSRLQKHLLGNLSIRGGQGHCAVRMNAENMADCGLRYDEICGIRIELHEYQYLEAQWSVEHFMPERQETPDRKGVGYQLRQPGPQSDAPDEEPVEVDLIVTPVSENVSVEKLAAEKLTVEKQAAEPVYEEIKLEEPSGDAEEQFERGDRQIAAGPAERDGGQTAIEQMTEDVKAADSMQELLEREVLKEVRPDLEETLVPEQKFFAEAQEAPQEVSSAEQDDQEISSAEQGSEEEAPDRDLQPDKWEQLRSTYPIVHPIREEEEYLKVSPRDFVIFPEKYQQLVHNSFLLHGYHNYKHLILGRKEKDGKVVYYLGVPGTFHDREKAVAVMFGFEAFDGKREPAQNGDFGYYLRRVEL